MWRAWTTGARVATTTLDIYGISSDLWLFIKLYINMTEY